MDASYQKLIHDYLDGSLSEEEQRRLFDNLSSDPEWREELNFQMRMQEAVQKDLSAVTIPVKTAASVYSALGFGLPQQEAVTLFTKIVAGSAFTKTVVGISALALIPAAVYLYTYTSQAPAPAKSVSVAKQQSEVPMAVNTISAPAATVVPVVLAPATKEPRPAAAAPADHKASLDIGKFSSVDYLSKRKIIGISSGGNIYMSEDGGTEWANLKSNTSKDLFGVHFRDSANGVVVGAEGTILLTADAGKNWAAVSSGTRANLIAVRYINHDLLFACGAQGTILMSTSGGLLWKKLESPVTASLFNIHFENSKNGIIRGEHGLVLQSTDGGLTWFEKTEDN